jgi:hypothetical protein
VAVAVAVVAKPLFLPQMLALVGLAAAVQVVRLVVSEQYQLPEQQTLAAVAVVLVTSTLAEIIRVKTAAPALSSSDTLAHSAAQAAR